MPKKAKKQHRKKMVRSEREERTPLTREMVLKAFNEDPSGEKLGLLMEHRGESVRSFRYAPRPFKPLPYLG